MDGTTATPSSGSTTTGPTSFSDPGLTWSGDSSTPTPSSDSTPAASASADATVPPAESSTPEGSPQQQGEPPKERWPDILANARAKEREAAIAEYRQRVGWAEQVNPHDFQHAVRLAQRLGTDPIAGLQEIIAEVRQNPQHEAALRSLAAKALAQSRQPQQPAVPQMRQVMLEDGSVVTVPADMAQYEAHIRQQVLDQVKQEFAPVTQTIESLQAERAAAVRAQQIDHFTTTTFADLQTWPGMESPDARAAVAKELAAARIDPNDPREVQLALHTAWRKVVVPTFGQQAEAKLLDSLKTKAAAATSVNPGSAAPSAPRHITRFDQLGPDAWR